MGDKEKIKIAEADFFSGIFAVFVLKGYQTVLFNKAFERGMAEMFRLLSGHEGEEIELDFRIRLHPIHNDSEAVHRGVYSSMQRGIISLDAPENRIIRIKLTRDEANKILDSLPGGGLFDKLSGEIIEIFSS